MSGIAEHFQFHTTKFDFSINPYAFTNVEEAGLELGIKYFLTPIMFFCLGHAMSISVFMKENKLMPSLKSRPYLQFIEKKIHCIKGHKKSILRVSSVIITLIIGLTNLFITIYYLLFFHNPLYLDENLGKLTSISSI